MPTLQIEYAILDKFPRSNLSIQLEDGNAMFLQAAQAIITYEFPHLRYQFQDKESADRMLKKFAITDVQISFLNAT